MFCRDLMQSSLLLVASRQITLSNIVVILNWGFPRKVDSREEDLFMYACLRFTKRIHAQKRSPGKGIGTFVEVYPC